MTGAGGAVRRLRAGIGGQVIVPTDEGYDAARIVWNGMIDRYPAVIVRCTSVGDVVAALRFAREQDLVVAVRGGGHSVGGFSTCDGGVVIDLSGMRGARVEPERRLARVNGGALLGELDHAAQAFGLACPVGVVSHTGVAGLTLGGGMGRLQRRFGFTIDNLAWVDLVAAEGTQVTASEEENPDLFWGVRGAGANFGIVTSFGFRLHEVGPMVTQGTALYPEEHAADAIDAFRQIVASAPDEFHPALTFTRTRSDDQTVPAEARGRPVVVVGVAHSGPVEDAEPLLAPVRATRPLVDTIRPKTYLEMQSAADDELAWGKRFYMKGGFARELSDALVDVCLSAVADAPGDCNVGFWTQGGAISRIPDDAMAFTGRHAPYWFGAEAFWTDPAEDEAFIGWGRRTWNALEPFAAAGHYVNDMVDTGDDVVRSIYGEGKYERLVALKRRYDPDNVFRLNQNVRP